MSTMVNIRYGSNIKPLSFNVTESNIPLQKEIIKEKCLDGIGKFGVGLMTFYSYSHLAMKVALGATATPDNIRANFSKIIDVFSAVAEPILWGFAIVGLVLVATGNKQMGWSKVKGVAYAYIGIQCLPAFFAFLRYIARMLTSAFSGM